MKRTLMILASLFAVTFLFAQTKTEIKTTDLPKAAVKYVKDNLPGATITRAFRMEENKVISYGTVLDIQGRKHILIFDKNGNFLKKGDNLVEDKPAKPPQKK